jgi:hypothetical protein
MRPAVFARQLLAALDASEGRRRRRTRDTRPDALGLDLERALLEALIREDPGPEALGAWLAAQCTGPAAGGRRALARAIWEEWQLAAASEEFRRWLEQGARSEDAAVPGGAAPKGFASLDGPFKRLMEEGPR